VVCLFFERHPWYLRLKAVSGRKDGYSAARSNEKPMGFAAKQALSA
jgi:hypothetical protein